MGKREHDHPDSLSSDPCPRSTKEIQDLETEDDLKSFNDMSNSELEELISLSPQKELITDEQHKHKSKKPEATS